MSLAFGGFALLIFSGMPIVLALGVAALVTIVAFTDVPLTIIAQRVYGGVNSFPLMAIPFFVAAGLIMEAGGIARRFVELATALVGWITGSLFMVAIVTGTGLAAISGSGSADTAAISSILVPEMKKRRYNVDMAVSIIAASGSMASIIPPSIVMVVIAITSNQSIGAMFLGGIGPGILISASLLVGAWLYARNGGETYRDAEPFSLKRLWTVFVDAVPALFVPIIIVGGIVGGVFTATEAACIAVFVTLGISCFIYRELKLSELGPLILRTVSLSAAVLIIVSTASIFSWIIASLGVTRALDAWLRDVAASPFAFLLIVNLLLLVVGMFMESISAILILLPVLMPIAIGYGIDPVQFGVLTALNLSIGLITPPYGICLYVASMVAGRRIEQAASKVWLPLIPMIIVLLLTAFVPAVTLFLPNLVYR
ncbi:TRAP transporter large permease [Martelella endophytica]|uniref:TRAP transporter large permease protein n=1 Tax=Martelella endophytica TaxID=1486262 RepID=A0A0D5LLE2_MAREN|nr:TRAP transporter large permease [Martelella endophytica]AJY44966.1 C4-dicarboxylate ABC transporter [Martelella endophytica]